MHDQLARWDWVREAGIALSRHITTLTTEHEQSTVSGEIFRTLIPACFQRIRVRTEATFSEVNATLPSLLCRFVAPDQAGQIMASIFTCLCNYNTEICGMAMAQTVVQSTPFQTPTGSNNLCGRACAGLFLALLAPVEVSFVPLSLPPLVTFQ